MKPPSESVVFLTGATGFIGTPLARRLSERGYRLRCLVRDPSRAGGLERLGAELIAGDLDDADALERGLAGADLAYHVAGVYQIGVVDRELLERVNVRGTRSFLAAARAAGTPRAVYVSSTVALGPVPPGTVGDEGTVHSGHFRSEYERTKTEAHRLAVQAQSEGFPLVIVCPALVYGPGDRGPVGDFLSEIRGGRLPALPRRMAWFSFVHVEDVAEGLVLAGERGRPGECYVLGGEHRSMDRFAAMAAEEMGTRLPRIRLPVSLVRLTGMALDPISRRTGRRFPITREGVDTTGGDLRWLHSHRKAERELGWSPRPLSEGLPETVASLG